MKLEERGRAHLAKHIRDVGDLEEKFAIGQEAFVLCTSRNEALMADLQTTVDRLTQEDERLLKEEEELKEAAEAKRSRGRR